jgi:UDP-glucose 4-epimerase
LLAEGTQVDVIDDYSTGSLANLADARSVSAGLLRVHQLDVRDDGVAGLAARRAVQTFYHLALLPPGETELAASRAAISGLLNVLEAARAVGNAKVVAALPGVSLFGDVSARDLPIKEGRPYTPTTARGVIARTAIDLLQVYRDQHGVDFTALVMSSIYGPRQRASDGVIAAFTEAFGRGVPLRVDGDGRQTRDFLFVDDAVDALGLARARASGLVVNVSTGEQTSIRDLAHLVTGASTEAGTPRRFDVGRFALSPVRARIHLQWSAWTPLRTGLTQLTAR